MTIIDKRSIIGNEYNACVICEYKRELRLLKRLIKISEKAIEQRVAVETWSFDGICYSFAKTIVDYSKMAYDNVLLGHFHAVNMILRSCLENLVLLDIIINNQSLELWKYYWVYSYRNIIYKSGRTPTSEEINRLKDMYSDLNISEDFYTRQEGRRKAYIQENYGWTYKINTNKQFTFENVCKLVDSEIEYKGFRLLSEYSHGTSFYTKLYSSVFVDGIMNMFVNLYINLYRMVTMYCWDNVDEDFDIVTDELECLFYNYIQNSVDAGNN